MSEVPEDLKGLEDAIADELLAAFRENAKSRWFKNEVKFEEFNIDEEAIYPDRSSVVSLRYTFSIPGYWFQAYAEGRGPVSPQRVKKLVWFRDPRQDPRIDTSIPEYYRNDYTPLTDDQYAYALRLNREYYKSVKDSHPWRSREKDFRKRGRYKAGVGRPKNYPEVIAWKNSLEWPVLFRTSAGPAKRYEPLVYDVDFASEKFGEALARVTADLRTAKKVAAWAYRYVELAFPESAAFEDTGAESGKRLRFKFKLK